MEERKDFTQQIAHISSDLKTVMERREQGLDEDWSEDALSAEEVSSITCHLRKARPSDTEPLPPLRAGGSRGQRSPARD